MLHAWGMTEMSPLGTVGVLKNQSGDPQTQRTQLLKQGRPVFGVDMKIVGRCGQTQAWDGKASGNLLVRGPWICLTIMNPDTAAISRRVVPNG